MKAIPEDLLDLLSRPLVAVCATIGPNGDSHAQPLWFLYDGGNLRISLVEEQQKYRNIRDWPAATLTVVDPENPVRYIELRCKLKGISADPDRILVHKLAERYGVPDFEGPPGTHVDVCLQPYHFTRFM